MGYGQYQITEVKFHFVKKNVYILFEVLKKKKGKFASEIPTP